MGFAVFTVKQLPWLQQISLTRLNDLSQSFTRCFPNSARSAHDVQVTAQQLGQEIAAIGAITLPFPQLSAHVLRDYFQEPHSFASFTSPSPLLRRK